MMPMQVACKKLKTASAGTAPAGDANMSIVKEQEKKLARKEAICNQRE